jgi:hypothetical protein
MRDNLSAMRTGHTERLRGEVVPLALPVVRVFGKSLISVAVVLNFAFILVLVVLDRYANNRCEFWATYRQFK